jgi:poly-gamma-glutamate synthesis protein (capsule biosynthesis protein)
VPRQRLEAHRLIDAGADALICHHTHTLQTIEQYHGHPIYYSIGNFIFDQQASINTQACLVKLLVTATQTEFQTIPVTIRRCVPVID